MKKLSLILKIFALLYWYLVAYFVAMLVLNHLGSNLLDFTLRGGEYRWDFEAFFTAIYLVWGAYLWKAAKNPGKAELFIQFTIWASLAHAFAMIAVGLLRSEEFTHLLTDSIVFMVPSLLLLYYYQSSKLNVSK